MFYYHIILFIYNSVGAHFLDHSVYSVLHREISSAFIGNAASPFKRQYA